MGSVTHRHNKQTKYRNKNSNTDLIPFIFEHGHLEELRVLNTDAAERQVSLEDFDVAIGELGGVVGLVDDLGDADHIALVIADGHAEDQVGLVARTQIDFVVESRIL
ncbi:hypothetical protein GWI33_010880 [Rhynchophorus ferrugineus]|uniref:Uncharacterized protein n=1 Tax=Rhynchophorus ferrugineus TaxID=354439 RepID=A0A834I8Z4_RHYFE|nr:hypothetical protein GWI33_010880 [Rhynchophorus ferrugineus]